MNHFIKTLAIITAVSILALAATAVAFGPDKVSYQGRLTDSSGQPLNGTFQVKFAIYADPSGSPFPAGWEETQSVTCVDGFFTVMLGSITPFNAAVLVYSQPYLGITVESDPEQVPRNKIAASMFALRVNSVDGASGGEVHGLLSVNNFDVGLTAIAAYGGLNGGYFYAGDEHSNAAGVEGVISPIVQDVDAAGVKGTSTTGDGWGIGGNFTGGYYGVQASAFSPDGSFGNHFGIRSTAHGHGGHGVNAGVDGNAGGALYNYGVRGHAYHYGTPGAYAYGIYGSATFMDGYGAWAGYFDGWTTCKGTLEVQGNLTKAAGSFRIDHPLDPENKFLQHSFVESPDMKNIYDGNVVTDQNGDATVTMPDWFDALNRDFRYQLTVIGQFAQAIVSEKLHGNTFRIKTDRPNVEVSWQVTGIRQDAYANSHRIEVEVAKKPHEVGLYIDPVAFGKPAEMQLHYKMNKAVEDQRKESEARAAKNRASK